MRTCILIVALAISRLAIADCTANAQYYPHQAPCPNCGDLQFNKERAVDSAINGLLNNPDIRLQLDLEGRVSFSLDNPPNSSMGVLWYGVTIEHSEWSHTHSQEYANAVELMRSLTTGVSVSAGHRGIGGELTAAEKEVIRNRIQRAIVSSTTRGNGPMRFNIHQADGTEVAERDVRQSVHRRNTTDNRYDADAVWSENSESDPNLGCLRQDPRHDSGEDEGSGGDEYDDSSDHYEGEENGREGRFPERSCGWVVTDQGSYQTCIWEYD